jgi:hypothetical protein
MRRKNNTKKLFNSVSKSSIAFLCFDYRSGLVCYLGAFKSQPAPKESRPTAHVNYQLNASLHCWRESGSPDELDEAILAARTR